MFSSIILVIIVIGSLIIVHELGHLILAKASGLPVEQFSVGFGPIIFRKRFKDTEYRLSLIPLGGYIKLAGDETDATFGFNIAPLSKKALVILAGPAFNLFLGIFLTWVLYGVFGVSTFSTKIVPEANGLKYGLQIGDEIIKINNETIPDWSVLEKVLNKYKNQNVSFTIKRGDNIISIPGSLPINPESSFFRPYIEPVIDIVKKQSPAEKVGLRKNDRILQVDSVPIYDWYQFTELIRMSKTPKRYLKWIRENTIYEDSIEISYAQDEIGSQKRGIIGVWVKLPQKKLSFFQALVSATERTVYVAIQTFVIIYKVIAGEIPKSSIGGPVMVGKLTYEGAQWGIKYLLGLWAVLSINLCVINLFPIPLLDGGRILLYSLESAFRKKFSKKIWEISFYLGYALVGLIVILALFNDITRIIKK
ncbi:MAG: RIP metalloprotease RseP [candidate division WOR-3 bacterium]|nr:RIP metalloprotease RseP [candidate division WOR-3 bacterium]MDW7987727.1 RIP metalloprotease RseP [candidate division WOR-3 bacterium]